MSHILGTNIECVLLGFSEVPSAGRISYTFPLDFLQKYDNLLNHKTFRIKVYKTPIFVFEILGYNLATSPKFHIFVIRISKTQKWLQDLICVLQKRKDSQPFM